ncbi:MAG: ABC transporter ATP-binding protein [Fretibacterium sp.]|nr:ABC transporter ATP-binding protein [Fretibacterium sp.]
MTLELRGLNVTYLTPQGEVPAVRGCDLTVKRGELTALVGESGCGKTSVLMAVPRLLPVSARAEGEILCDGTDLMRLNEPDLNRWRWRRLALVPQGSSSAFSPHLSIETHFREALLRHRVVRTGQAARARTHELLEDMGLTSSFARRYPHELSGGQKQRAALALALACDPDYLLADEPTTALDVVIQKEVMTLIADRTRSRGLGLLLVTHDLLLASEFCDTLHVMKDGRIVESGSVDCICRTPEHPYTQLLLAALVPDPEAAEPNARSEVTAHD